MNKQIQSILGKVLREGLSEGLRNSTNRQQRMPGRLRGKRSLASILGSLIAGGIILWISQNRQQQPLSDSITKPQQTASAPDRSHPLNAATGERFLAADSAAKLQLTKHAKCRMKCRSITQSEVQEVISSGTRNLKKSDLSVSPCPLEAMEGPTRDGQMIRVIVGRCDSYNKIITVIDLGKDHPCDCE